MHDETDETNAVKVAFRPNGKRVGRPGKAISMDALIIYSMERGLLMVRQPRLVPRDGHPVLQDSEVRVEFFYITVPK